jgi:hypothetical protein
VPKAFALGTLIHEELPNGISSNINVQVRRQNVSKVGMVICRVHGEPGHGKFVVVVVVAHFFSLTSC